jgi:hypothetical protein
VSASTRRKAILTRFVSFLARLWPGTRKRLHHHTGITPSGERAVAVGGNVEHSTIQTGDTYNVSFDPDELRTLVQEALQAVAQKGSVTLSSPALLSHTEFTGRLGSAALSGHAEELVGRASQLSTLQAALAGACRVALVHGAGGIGKTRLLLALSEAVPQEMHLWFARPGIDGEALARAIMGLDAEGRHLIVVDNVERMFSLYRLHDILLDPGFANRVQLVLATRSTFKDTVLDSLPVLPEERLYVLELPPLSPEVIDAYLQHPPHAIDSEDTRALIIRMASGNPLFAAVAAQLARRGIPLAHLTRDQAFSRYLEQLIRDLARSDNMHSAYALSILHVLSALGAVELDNEPLRECLRQEVGISVYIEEQLIAQLVRAGFVERVGMVLKLSSEVLADHLLFGHFFDPATSRANYRRQILEPFFMFKPKEILTSLARAEVIGGATTAGALLDELLVALRRTITTGGSTARFRVLYWLEDLAYLRPDAILDVVEPLIDAAAEQLPDTLEDPWFGTLTITHEQVLEHAVELLRKACYRGDLASCISFLRTLSLYRSEEQTYARAREKARAVLINLARFQPGVPYAVQRTMLDAVTQWLEQDKLRYFDLSITLLQTMLGVELEESRVSPLQPRTITISHGIIAPNEILRSIRSQVEDALFTIYLRTTTLAQRLAIARALEGTLPPVIPSGRVPDEMRDWLRVDAERTAYFFKDAVLPQEEFPVLDAVFEWLWRARHFSGYRVGIFDQLHQMLADHRLYQLYRVLAGTLWLNEADEVDWRAGRTFRQQAIEHFLETLTPTTIDQAIRDLALVAEQAHAAGNTDTSWLDSLLEDLGKRSTVLAHQMIEQTLANRLALLSSLDALLKGLRLSDPGAALAYMTSWTESNDVRLIEAVARSYHGAIWNTLQDEEWDLLRRLVTKGIRSVNYTVLSLIPLLAPHRPELAVELMKAIAANGDEYLVRRMAEILGRSGSTTSGWAVEIANSQDLLELCGYLVQLPTLDTTVLPCLERLGWINPMSVVDILERRIRQSVTSGADEVHYVAIPLELAHHAESIRSSTLYRNVLSRIRDWMMHNEPRFRGAAPYALKVIAGSLDEVLYSVLMEWVTSRDSQKQQAVADLLDEFNTAEPFYQLCRQLLLQSHNEEIEQAVEGAILHTPLDVWDSSDDWQEVRRVMLSSWLQDADPRISRFAQRLFRSLLRNRTSLD